MNRTRIRLRRIAPPTVLALVLLAGTGAARAIVPAKTDTVAEVARLYQAGELDRAEVLLRQALAKDPADGQLHYLLGVVVRDGSPSRPAEAIVAFRTALAHDPSLADAAAALAQTLLDSGRDAEAERFLRARVAAHPEEAASMQLLGAHLMRVGNVEEGEPLLVRATELEPLEPKVWLELGRGRLRAGRSDEAIEPLEKAVRLAPDDAPARYALSQAYMAVGNTEQAEAELAVYQRLEQERYSDDHRNTSTRRLYRAITLHHERLRADPDRSAAEYEELVALHAEADSLDELAALLDEIAAAHPDLAAPLVGQALLARRTDEARAWELLQQARQRQPHAAAPLQVMSQLIDSPERRREFASILRSLDGDDAAPPEVPLWLGLLALEDGRLEQAEALLGRARQQLPDDPTVFLNLGVLYGRTRRHTEALKMFARAVELDPSDGQAWFNMALSEAQLGDLDAAREHLRRSLDAGEAKPRVLNLLARILAAQGDRDEAIATLERSLSLEPDQPMFREMLETLRAEAENPPKKE